jgi:hypothetical protein
MHVHVPPPPGDSSDKELIEWIRSLGINAPYAIRHAAFELQRSRGDYLDSFKAEQRKLITGYLDVWRLENLRLSKEIAITLNWLRLCGSLPVEIHDAARKLENLIDARSDPDKQKELYAILSEYRRQQENELGAQIVTGNLLEWTEGNCAAAYASRYSQVCRLKFKNLSESDLAEAEAVITQAMDVITNKSKLARLKVALLEAQQQLSRLKQKREASAEAAVKASSGLLPNDEIDKDLTASLTAAIESARNQSGGFVYLKQWSLPNGIRWLKIGITNNPARRDAEQNVLPVPAVTLCLMETQSMDQAAAIEKALHSHLAQQKVTGAGNRELFQLDDNQLSALVKAMSN